jgi:NADH-quinone oxidoreductase E subunit
MSTTTHLNADTMIRARELIALYPEPRSAMIPLCHLAQEQDGWLTPEAMADIADLLGTTAAEVLGTASFYDMLHTEPVGTHVVSVCTNIACLLNGALELLEHAEHSLGVNSGGTTADGTITLEEAECLADCDRAPCVQVNHRFVGAQSAASFDLLVGELRSGARDEEIPQHGTLNRVRRTGGLGADGARIAAERQAMVEAISARAAAVKAAEEARAAEAAKAADEARTAEPAADVVHSDGDAKEAHDAETAAGAAAASQAIAGKDASASGPPTGTAGASGSSGAGGSGDHPADSGGQPDGSADHPDGTDA